ncbi:Putative permease [Candidatus Phaeomarinobacter ectocarpi]|uniref:Putative permease n=1 Tax=Candidatus Phaeomarinibacter ectocarpi TaxID=1458461 RepID=X5MP44_9HYPH|nr:AI-2E family transporter [Candidatus Phaeomarinobacter ectocarpi]CDO60896.2 Putative permease [Candidatus Phaeomarinobacter ectocarpi]
MTIGRQALIWAVVAIVFGLVLHLLSSIMLPFVAGMAIAYFLDPAADRLEDMGLSRMAATSVISVVGLLIFILVLVLVLPVLQDQIIKFIERAPGYVDQLRQLFDRVMDGRIAEFIAGFDTDARAAFTDIAKSAFGWAGQVFQRAISGGLAFVSFMSLVFVTPVVAFYLLLDWDRMVEQMDSWLPRDHAGTVRRLVGEMDGMLSGFVRGQVTVCFVLGTFYATALTLIGLDFGLVVGLIAGLVSFIPFVGALVGLVLSVGLALIQFWPDPLMIGAVAAVFFVGQAIEGNILTPWLVGSRVKLHPVWVIFALFAFGTLFGFVGVLLALPLAALIGVLMRFGIGEYLKSDLYKGNHRE